jgi:hypothetical protein
LWPPNPRAWSGYNNVSEAAPIPSFPSFLIWSEEGEIKAHSDSRTRCGELQILLTLTRQFVILIPSISWTIFNARFPERRAATKVTDVQFQQLQKGTGIICGLFVSQVVLTAPPTY